jgi:hypothetical protein
MSWFVDILTIVTRAFALVGILQNRGEKKGAALSKPPLLQLQANVCGAG